MWTILIKKAQKLTEWGYFVRVFRFFLIYMAFNICQTFKYKRKPCMVGLWPSFTPSINDKWTSEEWGIRHHRLSTESEINVEIKKIKDVPNSTLKHHYKYVSHQLRKIYRFWRHKFIGKFIIKFIWMKEYRCTKSGYAQFLLTTRKLVTI